MNSLPKITNAQQDIIKLLYRYRFLDRIQIQAFLKHKDKGRSNRWLKDLKEKQYIGQLYNSSDFVGKTKPAIYFLDTNGIRYLRTLDQCPSSELHKRYTEKSRKQLFIVQCLLLADCCLNMEARNNDASGLHYSYELEADYAKKDNEYHFLMESEFVHPHLCYVKTKGSGSRNITTRNLLEVFSASLPRHSVKKRLKDYVKFLNSYEWEEETKLSELPIILIVCPTKAGLIYAKRTTRQALVDLFGDIEEIPDDMHVRFTTVEKIKDLGITGKVWEEA